jgi:hypothetical protein
MTTTQVDITAAAGSVAAGFPTHWRSAVLPRTDCVVTLNKSKEVVVFHHSEGRWRVENVSQTFRIRFASASCGWSGRSPQGGRLDHMLGLTQDGLPVLFARGEDLVWRLEIPTATQLSFLLNADPLRVLPAVGANINLTAAIANADFLACYRDLQLILLKRIAPRNTAWEANLSEQLSIPFVSGVSIWQSGETAHIAAFDADTHLRCVDHDVPNNRYSVDDVTAATDHAIASAPRGWTTQPGGRWVTNIAGTTRSGELLVFQRSSGSWSVTNLTQQTGRRMRAVPSSVTCGEPVGSWQHRSPRRETSFLAAHADDGTLCLFSSETGGGWVVKPVAAPASHPTAGPVTGWTADESDKRVTHLVTYRNDNHLVDVQIRPDGIVHPDPIVRKVDEPVA